MDAQKARLALALQEKYEENRLLSERQLRDEARHRSTREEVEQLRKEISALNEDLTRINEYCRELVAHDHSVELLRLREEIAEL